MTRLRFLGQSGLRLEANGTVLYVDPCLSDYVAEVADDPGLWRRSFPPPLCAAEISDVAAVLCTHEHADHFDPRTLAPMAASNLDAVFVVPAPMGDLARHSLGHQAQIELARGLGEHFIVGPFAVFPVPAAHSTEYGVEMTDEGHRWLGFVIEVGGLRLYHAGDTVRDDAQVAAVQSRGPLDVALLPINGRDAYRDRLGLVGNLWPREAAELAVELDARALIPLHHDLFGFNGIRAGGLVDYVQAQRLGVEVRVLVAGMETVLNPSP